MDNKEGDHPEYLYVHFPVCIVWFTGLFAQAQIFGAPNVVGVFMRSCLASLNSL
jgi:hypothetical protein